MDAFETPAARSSIAPPTLATLWIACLLVVLANCSGGESLPSSGATLSPAKAAPSVRETPNLGDVMRRVHFAFRPVAGGLEGGHVDYGARVASGAIHVTPMLPGDGDRDEGRAAPLVIRTSRIARGDGAGALPQSEPKLRADASAEIDRGVAVEHVANQDDGVEQSFEFAKKPEGRGDLTVRLDVSGQAYAGVTDEGIHFEDLATGLGVRVGRATWIDANGKRTEARARFAGGAIEIDVPSKVVEESAYPAVLDPTIGPEFGMDDPVPKFAVDTQSEPEIAFGSANHLVVWADHRDGNWDIYGARVAPSGAVLDPSGIAICTALGDQEQPSVVWGGTQWMVVWRDLRTNASGDIYGARVSAGGAVLDPGGVAIEAGGIHIYPRVASDGTNYLATYGDVNRSKISAVRFGPTGTALGGSILLENQAPGTLYPPNVGWNGTNYLVAYSYFVPPAFVSAAQRISPAGVVLDASPIIVSASKGGGYRAAIASDGVNWLVAWWLPNTTTMMFQRVKGDGTLLDGFDGKVLSSTSGNPRVSAVYGGNAYGIFWDYAPIDFNAARVSAGGVVLSTANLVLTEGAPYQRSQVAVSHDGANYLIAFADQRNAAGDDIFAARINASLAKVDPSAKLVSGAANGQTNPAVAFNGTNYLVAWEDTRAGAYLADIFATRVSQTGTVLDPSGITVSAAANDQRFPSVASNGTDWLVAWQDARNPSMDIYATRVSSTGAVMDPNGIAVNTDPDDGIAPAVASDGTDYLVAWNDGGAARTRRVTATGTLPEASTGLTLATSLYSVEGPALAFNGTSYLVAWANAPQDVYGARVTKQNVAIDPMSALLPISANANFAERSVGVASNGTDWLVVCMRSAGIPSTIGVRVTGGGAVLDPAGISLSSATSEQYVPKVAWDGAQYWSAWQDDRNGRFDIYGTRVTSAGAALDPLGVSIANSTEHDLAPALAAGPAGQVFLAYHRFDETQPYGGVRVRGRILTSTGGNGGACSVTGDCASGHCVDGVCCNVACTGLCQACSAAKKGGGADGTCGPIMALSDPDNECSDMGALSCGTSGTCDGAGACKLYAAGTACGATCVGNGATPKSCDGLGTCVNGAAQPCAPYACSAGVCKTSCVTAADCAAGLSCNGGVCNNLAPNGAACAMGAQCQSGICADGVCCNAACNGACQACTAVKKGTGSDGACGPIAMGSDPDNECAQQAQSTCGTTGVCNGAGACQLFAQGTSCGTSQCAGSVVTGQVCNGVGACVLDTTGQDCAPYACAGGGCKNPCAVATDCAPGAACKAGVCLPSGSPGLPCGAGPECLSGLCVDGVCCDTACLGACVACTAAKKGGGADGVCGPIAANTDPDNECAAQVPSTCKQTGTCDGKGACGLYTAGTVCAPSSCSGASQTAVSSCDGAGTCAPGATTSCVEGYLCSGSTCATGCTDDTPCAPGFACDLQFNACAPITDAGAGGSGMGGSGGSGGNATGSASATGGSSATGGNGGSGTATGLGGEGGSSVGSGDAGTDAGRGANKPDDSGCGCEVVGNERAGGSAGWGAIVALGVMAVRRRRRSGGF